MQNPEEKLLRGALGPEDQVGPHEEDGRIDPTVIDKATTHVDTTVEAPDSVINLPQTTQAIKELERHIDSRTVGIVSGQESASEATESSSDESTPDRFEAASPRPELNRPVDNGRRRMFLSEKVSQSPSQASEIAAPSTDSSQEVHADVQLAKDAAPEVVAPDVAAPAPEKARGLTEYTYNAPDNAGSRGQAIAGIINEAFQAGPLSDIEEEVAEGIEKADAESATSQEGQTDSTDAASTSDTSSTDGQTTETVSPAPVSTELDMAMEKAEEQVLGVTPKTEGEEEAGADAPRSPDEAPAENPVTPPAEQPAEPVATTPASNTEADLIAAADKQLEELREQMKSANSDSESGTTQSSDELLEKAEMATQAQVAMTQEAPTQGTAEIPPPASPVAPNVEDTQLKTNSELVPQTPSNGEVGEKKKRPWWKPFVSGD